VTASTDDGHVLIDVEDEGRGIPPEDQELIFEKFGRSSGGTAKPGDRPRAVHRTLDRRSAAAR
jgi:signal transduction histidine kinase